jgi:hypothetical protein
MSCGIEVVSSRCKKGGIKKRTGQERRGARCRVLDRDNSLHVSDWVCVRVLEVMATYCMSTRTQRQTDTQTDRQTDTQTDRQTDRATDRKKDRQTGPQK